MIFIQKTWYYSSLISPGILKNTFFK
jgi:hypothetical protein